MLRHRYEFQVEGELPGFDGATAWLNSAPLNRTDLKGRVALVNFGTYTCINWIRSLPYVRAWSDKYAEHGLVVVGIEEITFIHLVAQFLLDQLAQFQIVDLVAPERLIRIGAVNKQSDSHLATFINHFRVFNYFLRPDFHLRPPRTQSMRSTTRADTALHM